MEKIKVYVIDSGVYENKAIANTMEEVINAIQIMHATETAKDTDTGLLISVSVEEMTVEEYNRAMATDWEP